MNAVLVSPRLPVTVQGEHQISDTREPVVPRVERALAEVQDEIEHGSRPIRSDCAQPRKTQMETTSHGLRTAGHVRFPEAGAPKALARFNISRGLS